MTRIEFTDKVRTVLRQDFVGARLEVVTAAVVAELIRNLPEIEDENEDEEVFEELVWDAAARVGY